MNVGLKLMQVSLRVEDGWPRPLWNGGESGYELYSENLLKKVYPDGKYKC